MSQLPSQIDPGDADPLAHCRAEVSRLNRQRRQHTVKVQARNAFFPEETEQISPDNRAQNSKPDIEPETLALRQPRMLARK